MAMTTLAIPRSIPEQCNSEIYVPTPWNLSFSTTLTEQSQKEHSSMPLCFLQADRVLSWDHSPVGSIISGHTNTLGWAPLGRLYLPNILWDATWNTHKCEQVLFKRIILGCFLISQGQRDLSSHWIYLITSPSWVSLCRALCKKKKKNHNIGKNPQYK